MRIFSFLTNKDSISSYIANDCFYNKNDNNYSFSIKAGEKALKSRKHTLKLFIVQNMTVHKSFDIFVYSLLYAFDTAILRSVVLLINT